MRRRFYLWVSLSILCLMWCASALGAPPVEAGIIQGYPGHFLRGKRPLTRAELAVIVTRLLLRLEQEPQLALDHADFKDLSGSEWAYSAILAATGTGMMQGYPDHTFRPDRHVTFNELAVTLARLSRYILLTKPE